MWCSRQGDLMAVLQLAAGQQQSAVASVKHGKAGSCTSPSTSQLLGCVMQLRRPLLSQAACGCGLTRGATWCGSSPPLHYLASAGKEGCLTELAWAAQLPPGWVRGAQQPLGPQKGVLQSTQPKRARSPA